jgi:GNAT superfamily N-acetyltransferase
MSDSPSDRTAKAIGCRIRRAEEHLDWRALRMLLPHAVHYGCSCDVFVATDDESSRRLIGAIAVAPLMRLQPYRGPRVALHVISPWRRRGVGRALVAAAVEVSAARGADALYAWDKMSPDGVDAQVWRRLGFDKAIESSLTRIDATRTIEALQPLVSCLIERKYIPAEARLVPLREADINEIVELVTTFLAGAGDEAGLKNRLIGNHPLPLEPLLSKVLLFNDRVAGVMLGSPINKHVGLVEVNVIHPMLRGGWANVWLKLETTRIARDAGYQTFLYETHEQHADTKALTRRVGGVVVPRIEPYRLIATNAR